MSARKTRLSVTMDPDVADYAEGLVEASKAASVSAVFAVTIFWGTVTIVACRPRPALRAWLPGLARPERAGAAGRGLRVRHCGPTADGRSGPAGHRR